MLRYLVILEIYVMKKISLISLAVSALVVMPSLGFAKDVTVKGYHRSDGTYVRPHIRSSPDSSISNNYGPSTNSYQLMKPRTRDYDRDGTPNYLDSDSDNDGYSDNNDSNPYGLRN